MKNLLVLGIMSGTSIDSVDYALCQVNEKAIKLQAHWQVRFPSILQMQLHQAARGELQCHQLAQLHHDVGRFYAVSALHHPAAPALVGLHGQTIFHHPNSSHPATFQAGEPAYLVEALRVPVVSNFRAGDMAAGGQGAPLATIFHRAVFAQRGIHVCVNNLGGISNVTSLDWREGRAAAVLAFDTGPANVLIDLAARHITRGESSMDRDGAWAAQGKVCQPLVQEWLTHSYFAQSPPKSTGRELFGERFFKPAWRQMQRLRLSDHDALATLTEFSAQSLALNYRMHLPALPQSVVLTGGGALNRALAGAIERCLRESAPDIFVVTSEHFGWPVQVIEPAAFAYLAYLRYHKIPGNIPNTTGAARAVLLGQLNEC